MVFGVFGIVPFSKLGDSGFTSFNTGVSMVNAPCSNLNCPDNEPEMRQCQRRPPGLLRQAQNRLKLLIAQENSVAVLALASGLTGHPGGGSAIREAAPGPGVRPTLSAA